MIQSVKFDSSKMDIKKLTNNALTFVVRRLIEISGIFVCFIGLLILAALISYSPTDPNFIFPENTEINNILGFRGSYLSDLFFQSVGLISYLIPVTLICTGFYIFKEKELFLILENTFYIILYCLVGSLFLSYFYKNSFILFINGNGGFLGTYLNQNFLNSLISSNESFFYYFLIIAILIFFLISLNFSPKKFIIFLRKINSFIFNSKKKNYTNENEIISEYIPQEEIKNLIQEDLPFIKVEDNQKSNNKTFKIPSIDLLKIPTKKEKENSDNNENNDPAFLEKILLDFGVDGKI